MSSLKIILPIVCIGLLTISCGNEENDFIDRMSVEHENDLPVVNASAVEVQATGEEVTYATVNGTDITGFIARPSGVETNLPGLIVIHEWWGLNDNIRMMTRRLADQGYVALAVDLYNGRVAETPQDAGQYAGSVNQQQATENLRQALAYLNEQEGVTGIGTIGWCFGGGWSLRSALAMTEEIDATVIYYGQLVTDAGRLEELEMPILGIFGSEDSGIPPQEVRAFESALNQAGVENSIHIYEGANHAFANPSGTQYDAEAAADAWQKTVVFLEQHLK